MKTERVMSTIDATINAKRTKSLPQSETCQNEMMLESMRPTVLPTQDETLVEMILQSNATTYDEILNFCLSVGIPVSRVLQLDLMRLAQMKSSKESESSKCPSY